MTPENLSWDVPFSVMFLFLIYGGFFHACLNVGCLYGDMKKIVRVDINMFERESLTLEYALSVGKSISLYTASLEKAGNFADKYADVSSNKRFRYNNLEEIEGCTSSKGCQYEF